MTTNSFLNKARHSRIKTTILGSILLFLVVRPLYLVMEPYRSSAVSILIISLLIFVMKILSAGEFDRLAGKAELKVYKHLKKLPESFVIYNQIKIPSKKSNKGFFELDYLLISPNAMYIIEVKRYKGKIIGSNSDDWKSVKIDRFGNTYTKNQKNPFIKVIRQIQAVRGFIRNFGMEIPIHGIVYLDGLQKDSKFPINTRFQVFSNKKLRAYIKSLDDQNENLTKRLIEGNTGQETYFNLIELFRLLKNGTIM